MKWASPINLQTPIRFQDPLPDAIDVVIVGAGVIGISTALYLADRGLRAVVLEKGRVAGEQSSRNWGWVRQTGRDAGELPIMMESIRLWQALHQRTGREELRFIPQGVLYLADNADDQAYHNAFFELARQHELDSRLLSSEETAALLPNARKRWPSALYTPGDGRIEPWYAVPTLAEAAQHAGVLIRENCTVTSLEAAAGQIRGVNTEHGMIRAEQVVVCAGAWSSTLLDSASITLPQLSVRATVARIETDTVLGPGNAVDTSFGFAPRVDGGYTIALGDHQDFFIGPNAFRHLLPFKQAALSSREETRFYPAAPANYPDAWVRKTMGNQTTIVGKRKAMRVLDPPAEKKLVDQMIRNLHERFGPVNATVTQAWAGMIDTMPDFVPVIDQIDSISGLTVATGFSGHGFGIGPGAGRVVASLLAGEPAGHDLHRFRFSRFAEGGPFELGPH